ncbi:MAG: DUF1015 domain-containing protein [Acholeplasmataceae bacterium]|jgi:uncharacterized protein (DUF1015 family)|nr:DUF1015 domain-containing protein [Acholeplasmataceae bacterium]
MSLKFKDQPIVAPDFLLPRKGIDLSKWAVVACDQFTSSPEYWSELNSYIDEEPSTAHMILPEVYLEKMKDNTIQQIHKAMMEYLKDGTLQSVGSSFMLIERITNLNVKRLGLMVAIDLEAYDYEDGTKPLIRTTEKTIVERIPPRVKIRENAPLELSHIMLLINDKKHKIIESLYEKRLSLKKRYDFVLNMMGGHIRGYQIFDTDPITEKFYDLIEDENDPILAVVGDGNHSLATAKAHWENVKKQLIPEQQKDHPARFAMVEIVNIYDPGLEFEGIHRVLFNVKDDFLIDLFHAVDKDAETWVFTKELGKEEFYIPKSTAEAYEQIQSFIDRYMQHHPNVTIDYIHGEDELMRICKANPNAVGIKMPTLAKKDLFPFIQTGKVLPRKSFSMGSATAKRYYLESRRIKY